MRKFLKNIGTVKLSFVSLFVLLSILVSGLKLYLDDIYWLYPATSGKYLIHFTNYIHYFGAFRPLKLIYYYFIFTVYHYFPAFAHLFPFLLTVLTGILIYKILLREKIVKWLALSIAFVSITLPFTVESYGWLSANGAIIAGFIFFLQVYLIDRFGISFKNFILLLILQTAITFIYETTLFMPAALGMIWTNNQGYNLLSKEGLRKYVYFLTPFLIPLILMLLLRHFFPIHLDMRSETINPLILINNWRDSLSVLATLFSAENISQFWIKYALDGLKIITGDIFLSVLCIFFVVLSIFAIFEKDTDSSVERKPKVGFWFLALLLALAPLSWQNNQLPFRLLMLPTILIFIMLAETLMKLKPKSVLHFKFATLTIIIYFLLLHIAILRNYKLQYESDAKAAREISLTTDMLYGPHPYQRTNILLTNVPNNMLKSFIYGDFLLSAYYYNWSGEYFINHISNEWETTAVELYYNHIFRSFKDKATFMKMRPLTIFTYTSDNKCRTDECFTVVSSIK